MLVESLKTMLMQPCNIEGYFQPIGLLLRASHTNCELNDYVTD